MAYPLTGSAPSAPVVVRTLQLTTILPTRTWGLTAFTTFARTTTGGVAVQPSPTVTSGGTAPTPTTGQMWPRGGRTQTG